MKKSIYTRKGKSIQIDIIAEIDAGKLIISDLSGGKSASAIMGSDFIEQYLDLDKVNTKKLFDELKVSDKSKSQQLDTIKEKFGTSTAISDLEKYCKEHDIETSFFAWP